MDYLLPGVALAVLGVVLGPSWLVLGRLRVVLGRLGAALGPSWGALGGPGGFPEGSWGVPGGPGEVPGGPGELLAQGGSRRFSSGTAIRGGGIEVPPDPDGALLRTQLFLASRGGPGCALWDGGAGSEKASRASWWQVLRKPLPEMDRQLYVGTIGSRCCRSTLTRIRHTHTAL